MVSRNAIGTILDVKNIHIVRPALKILYIIPKGETSNNQLRLCVYVVEMNRQILFWLSASV